MTSSQRRLEPPQGGTPPPQQAPFGARDIHLLPLAESICRRYRAEFPDEEGRYGDAGMAWCVHDLQWILSWAAERDLASNVAWLARVLAARDFPVERLARALELAAEELEATVARDEPAAADLRAEADGLRS